MLIVQKYAYNFDRYSKFTDVSPWEQLRWVMLRERVILCCSRFLERKTGNINDNILKHIRNIAKYVGKNYLIYAHKLEIQFFTQKLDFSYYGRNYHFFFKVRIYFGIITSNIWSYSWTYVHFSISLLFNYL